MLVEKIAQVAHEINKAYCLSIGDDSQVNWDEAPEWQKESAINGVMFHVENPDVTPEQSHKNWVIQKVADGWVKGDVKDAVKKTHPCIEHYSLLPLEQRVKDFLFKQVVHSLKDL